MSGTPLQSVTSSNFEQLVLKAPGTVLVDCWATWCTSCKALEPKLMELAGEFAGRATVVKLNAEDEVDLAAQYRVRGLPAMLFFKNGQLRGSLAGNQTKESIRAALSDLV